MTGWDKDFLQDAVDRCTNESGELFDCPTFMENGPLQTEQEQSECLLEDPEIDLSVDSVLGIAIKALPGNVQIIGSGSGDSGSTSTSKSAGFIDSLTSAFGFGSTPTTTSHSAPTLSYNSATSDSLGVPGGAFIESETSSSEVTPTSSPTPDVGIQAVPTSFLTTTPPAQPQVTSEPGVSYEVVSTEIVTQGSKVQEIVWKEAVVYVTEDSVTTTTVQAAPAKRSDNPEKARRNHWLRHQHHGRRG